MRQKERESFHWILFKIESFICFAFLVSHLEMKTNWNWNWRSESHFILESIHVDWAYVSYDIHIHRASAHDAYIFHKSKLNGSWKCFFFFHLSQIIRIHWWTFFRISARVDLIRIWFLILFYFISIKSQVLFFRINYIFIVCLIRIAFFSHFMLNAVGNSIEICSSNCNLIFFAQSDALMSCHFHESMFDNELLAADNAIITNLFKVAKWKPTGFEAKIHIWHSVF